VHHRSHLSLRRSLRYALVVLALTACSGGGSAPPAPQAGSAACSALEQRLPRRVLDAERGSSDDAGTALWGDPAIVLRCGLAPPGPTSTPCTVVNDVDWLFEDGDDEIRFTSYGREPAVEVTVPLSYGRGNAASALVDLAGAVSPLPARRRCS
jgi:hypothetical protein